MLELYQKSTFKKQIKKYKHDKKLMHEIAVVIDILINEQQIPKKYKNHKLIGNYDDMMELHVRPDELLIYFKIEHESVTLVAFGSHAELFQ